jgi:hypothetical protein
MIIFPTGKTQTHLLNSSKINSDTRSIQLQPSSKLPHLQNLCNSFTP